MMTDVIVVGGGLSALTAAWKLEQAGHSVKVMDQDSRPGGNMQTLERDGFRYETGPHSFMGSAEYMWELIRELNFDDHVEKALPVCNNRYIFRDGRLVALPLSAGSFFTSGILSLKGKLRLCLEPFMPGGANLDDTAWDFFVRRFGREAATYIMSPFISGVYAGDVYKLGAATAFPKFWNFERENGSMILGAAVYMWKKKKRLRKAGIKYKKGLFSFRGGIGGLTVKLAQELGNAVEFNKPVSAIMRHEEQFYVQGDGWQETASAVVLASPPGRTARIIRTLLPEASGVLKSIPMAPVSVVHWHHPADGDAFPQGFGFLVPRISGMHTLGTLFPSTFFNGRAPDGKRLFVSFYGGMTEPETADLSDDQLKELVIQEHGEFFQRDVSRAEVLDILRYPQAIPQMMPDHTGKIEAILDDVKHVPGLYLAGNYITGVGVEHAAASGYTAFNLCNSYLQSRRNQP